MATKKKATPKSAEIEIRLKFDPKEGRWDATIDGQVYGQHRWERRAFDSAKKNYIERENVAPQSVSFVAKIVWPAEMKKAYKVFQQSKKTIEELEQALEEAKASYDLVCGEYIAAWRDAGLSKSGSCEMVGISNNTAQGYMDKAGGSIAAAEAMWRKAGVKGSAGMLERSSPRTNPSSSVIATTEKGGNPFYQKKPR